MTFSPLLHITQPPTERYLISWECYLHVQGDSHTLSCAHIPPIPGGLGLLQADNTLFAHPDYIPHTIGGTQGCPHHFSPKHDTEVGVNNHVIWGLDNNSTASEPTLWFLLQPYETRMKNSSTLELLFPKQAAMG